MDQSRGLRQQWLAEADEEDIATVIYEYGEERFSRRIARAIVARRQDTPITGTRDLCRSGGADLSNRKACAPATRTFQAIRIFINRELEDLQQCLQGSWRCWRRRVWS